MNTDDPESFVDPDSPTSVRPRLTPTAVSVGCPTELAVRCKEILADLGIGLETCAVSNYRGVATRLWPPVILMSDAVYAFDPEGFSEIAGALGSLIVRIERDDIAAEELHALIVAAVFKAMPHQESLHR